MGAANVLPWQLDFNDPYNPALLNQFAPERRPAEAGMLQSELWQALRHAAGYETRIQTIPDERNVTVLARAPYEARFYVPHGSFLIALTAASTEPEGFRAQIADLGNGGTLFSTPLLNSQLAPASTAEEEENNSLIHFLQFPRPILSPGLLAAQIINLAPADNRLQLALWFISPSGDVTTRNQWNEVLDRAIAAQTTVRRGFTFDAAGNAIAPAAGPAAAGPYPWVQMPPNGRPFRYENPIPTPAALTEDTPIIQFTVPQGYTAAIKRHRHGYNGPGFAEGSGDLIWRITVDGASSPGYDDMRTTAGSASDYIEIDGAILAQSGQTVRYTVSVGNVAFGADVIAGLYGYFYPQQ